MTEAHLRQAERVLDRVRELFGGFPGGARLPPPATVEPPQRGVRRVEVRGPGTRKRFEIAYRAPAVTDPDWPAFLLLQQVLAGGRGVNFAQNEFGDPVRPTSRLARLAGHSVPLLRNIRQSGYLTFVITQGVFFLILVHKIVIGHQRNLADISGYNIHGLGQPCGMAPQ